MLSKHPLYRITIIAFVIILSLVNSNNLLVDGTNVYIGGHRGNGCSTPGCSSFTAENSISGIKEAIRKGAKYIEIDLWLSLDNQVVVVHGISKHGSLSETVVNGGDYNIEHSNFKDLVTNKKLYHRTAWSDNLLVDETGDIGGRNMTASRELAAQYKKSSKKVQETAKKKYRTVQSIYDRSKQIPTLQELFEAVCYDSMFIDGDVKFILELKGSRVELISPLLDIVEKHQQCVGMFSSFHYIPNGCTEKHAKDANKCPNGAKSKVGNDLLKPLQEQLKQRSLQHLPVALLFNGAGMPLPGAKYIDNFLKEYESNWMHCKNRFGSTEKDTLKTITQKMHDLNHQVMIYTAGYNAETYDELVEAVEAEVDIICTNDIELTKKALGNAGKL